MISLKLKEVGYVTDEGKKRSCILKCKAVSLERNASYKRKLTELPKRGKVVKEGEKYLWYDCLLVFSFFHPTKLRRESKIVNVICI